jgi:hypothetical protein
VVSNDAETLKECCQALTRLEVEVDGAIGALSTISAEVMLGRKNYHMLVVDPMGIDWHRLQLYAAIHSLKQRRIMPVVAVLHREGTRLKPRWGEGNDFDEALSFPLKRAELESFTRTCAHHFLAAT